MKKDKDRGLLLARNRRLALPGWHHPAGFSTWTVISAPLRRHWSSKEMNHDRGHFLRVPRPGRSLREIRRPGLGDAGSRRRPPAQSPLANQVERNFCT